MRPRRTAHSPSSFLVLLCGILVSCQSGMPAQDSASRQSEERVVFLVRHAEKCLGEGEDPSLTAAGAERSLALVRTLKNVPLEAIYTTPFRRTVATAEPVADDHGLELIRTPITNTFLDDLAATIKSGSERFVLVSGHSDTTPELVNRLAGTELGHLADDVYDRLFVVTLRTNEAPSVIDLGYGAPSAPLTECPSE